MNHQSDLATATVIQQSPTLQAVVLSPRHEVVWPNTSTAALHPVRVDGADVLLLRAIYHAGHWVLFDLARLLRSSDVSDIKTGPSRDQPGLVMYALRRTFHNAPAFVAAAEGAAISRWPGDPRSTTQRPPASRPIAPPVAPVGKPTRAPGMPRPQGRAKRTVAVEA